VFSIDTRNAISVSGPQKLLNRFVKCLFTTQGSDPLHRKAGTDIAPMLNGNVLDPEDVQAAFILAIGDAESQIKAIDQRSPWLTADERLGAASMTVFRQIGPTRYEVVVELTTTSGARVLALLPFAME
jgi:hypothetical protein